MVSAAPAVRPGLVVMLDHLFMLGVLVAVAAILTAALVIQLGFGELPCPLCLLQRVAMFGVCFGIVQNFRNGFTNRHTGISLLFALLLLLVAARQTLLDIAPRPGHEYIGSAVLGLHMPVWSVVIALALLLAYAAKLAVLGGDPAAQASARVAVVDRAGHWLGHCVLGLCAVNLVLVLLQCGLGECHTFGYRLLG
jgi:disulfide bond formation protein DsbB